MSVISSKLVDNSGSTIDQVARFFRTDFMPGILANSRWYQLALREIKGAYRRSYLGIIWISLSMAITIVSLSAVYTFLFPTTLSEYMPFLAVSYVTWNLIAGSLITSCNVFIKNAGYIKQKKMPYTIFIMSNMTANIYIFLNQIIIAVIVAVIFRIGFSYSMLILPVGLFIIAWTAFAMSMILSTATCRYRDIGQVIVSITQLAFFITPVLWKPEYLSGRFFIAEVNPFYHFIQLIRAPIIDHTVPLFSFGVAIAISVVLTLIGFWVMGKNQNNIPFWV